MSTEQRTPSAGPQPAITKTDEDLLAWREQNIGTLLADKTPEARIAAIQAQLEAANAAVGRRQQAESALFDAGTSKAREANDALLVDARKRFFDEITKLTTTSVDRARDNAKQIQVAAAAIATLYTGVLGTVYSVTDNPLPLRGVIAPFFLAISVALSTAYLVWLKRPVTINIEQPNEGVRGAFDWYKNIAAFVDPMVRGKKWLLRASVVSLAAGVLFIAAPFLTSDRPTTVPDAPAMPVLPEVIAPDVAAKAAEVFNRTADTYIAAVDARNKAITDAANDASKANQTIDLISFAGSLVAIGAVVLVPTLAGRHDRKKPTTPKRPSDAAVSALVDQLDTSLTVSRGSDVIDGVFTK